MMNIALQRVQRDFKEVATNEDGSLKGIKVELVNDNFYHLRGEILGPPDTPYEGGTFVLDVRISDNYPFQPPQIKFITRIWHPNISSQTGCICIDILKDQWSASMSFRTIFLSLQALLCSPEPTDPQDAVVARQYQRNNPLFRLTARHWAQQYASAPGPPLDEAQLRQIREMGVDAAWLFIGGGYDWTANDAQCLRSVEAFDLSTLRSRPLPGNMPGGSSCTAANIAGLIYIQPRAGTICVFDSLLSEWARFAPPPSLPSVGFTLCNLDGELYAIGGRDADGHFRIVLKFDTQRETWVSRAPMTTARESFAVCALGDDTLCTVGGEVDGKAVKVVEMYNRSNDLWSPVAAMQQARRGACAAVVGERLYAMAGVDENGNYLSSVEVYDLTAQQWLPNAVPPMRIARRGARAVVRAERIFIVGGQSDDLRSLNSIEFYDVNTNREWTLCEEPMLARRFEAGVALVCAD